MFTSFNARAVGLDLSIEETLALAAEAGFGGVDVLVRDLVDAGAAISEVRLRMDDLGLRPGAFPMPIAWRGEPAAFARDLDRLPQYAEAAARLGLRHTGTWVMPETPGRLASRQTEADCRAEVMRLHLDRLGAIARVLADHGIALGLEVIGVPSFRTGRGVPFIARMADLGGLLETLSASAPNVGVLVDSLHLFAAEEEMEAGLRWGVERVVWVHVADMPASFRGGRHTINDDDRGLPGETGNVENATLLAKLDEAGYDGPVTAEPMASCRTLAGLSAKEVVHRVAASLGSVWPDRTH